jgi:hypothetical protein
MPLYILYEKWTEFDDAQFWDTCISKYNQTCDNISNTGILSGK